MTIVLSILLMLAGYQIWVQRVRLRKAQADEAELRDAYKEATISYARLQRNAFDALKSSHMKMIDEKNREIRSLKAELDRARRRSLARSIRVAAAELPEFDKR